MKLFKFSIEYKSAFGSYLDASVGVFAVEKSEALETIRTKWIGEVTRIESIDYGCDHYMTSDEQQLSDYFRILSYQKAEHYKALNEIDEQMSAIGYAIGRGMTDQYEVISGVLWKSDEESGYASPISTELKVY